MKTFDDRIREVGGFGPGFDCVRIVLALGVMAWHAQAVTLGTTAGGKQGPLWILFYALVPMFFALSGFLVTGSALRLPLRHYLANRVVRIVPALAVDVGFSALLLGPLLTALPLGDYFADARFRGYFLNIFGLIHYALPGVFLGNADTGVVNGSLWTVPFELGCYVVMSGLIGAGVIRSARVTGGLALAWLVMACLVSVGVVVTGFGVMDRGLALLFASNGGSLIGYFLAGAALYLGRAHVPCDGRIALACAALLAAASLGLDGAVWTGLPLGRLLAAAPLVYLVIYLGLQPLPRLPLFDRGDYSYGVYLYHYPLLQALQQLFGFGHWWLLFGAALGPVTAMAMFSWHNVEKPALLLRRRFSLVGARIERAPQPGGTPARAFSVRLGGETVSMRPPG